MQDKASAAGSTEARTVGSRNLFPAIFTMFATLRIRQGQIFSVFFSRAQQNFLLGALSVEYIPMTH